MTEVAAVRDEWTVADLDLDAYLARLGLTGLPSDGPDALRTVHRAHALTIPFENLDVILGHGVRVDLASVQDKLVRRRRGGYCYEHALLFGAAAERLGFGVTRLLARIGSADETPRARTHMVTVVEVDERRWFCDVGFGSGLLEPLPLAEGAEPVAQGAWSYRLRATAEGEWELLETADGVEHACYRVALDRVHLADVVVSNHYTGTWPESPFQRGPIVVRKSPQEVRRLLGRHWEVERPGHEREERVLSDAAYVEALADLDIALEPDDLDRMVALLPAPQD